MYTYPVLLLSYPLLLLSCFTHLPQPHQPHPAVVCLFSFFSILDVAQEEAQPLQDTGTGLRADDTTVIGQITDGDETAYREEVENLTSWCQDNNLHINVSKSKELVVDYRKQQREGHVPIAINGSAASGSSVSTSLRTWHGLITQTPSPKQLDRGSFFPIVLVNLLNMLETKQTIIIIQGSRFKKNVFFYHVQKGQEEA